MLCLISSTLLVTMQDFFIYPGANKTPSDYTDFTADIMKTVLKVLIYPVTFSFLRPQNFIEAYQ